MKHSVTCMCGYRAEAQDDEELYSLVRGHVDPRHPEMHRPDPEQVPTRAALTALFTTGKLRVIGSSKTGR